MQSQESNEICPEEAASVVTEALVHAAADLKFTNEELGQIIGVSPAFVSQMRTGKKQLSHGKKPYQLAQLLLRVYRSLYPMAGGDVVSMQQWLRHENNELEQAPPLTHMLTPQGLVGVLDYLDGYRARI